MWQEALSSITDLRQGQQVQLANEGDKVCAAWKPQSHHNKQKKKNEKREATNFLRRSAGGIVIVASVNTKDCVARVKIPIPGEKGKWKVECFTASGLVAVPASDREWAQMVRQSVYRAVHQKSCNHGKTLVHALCLDDADGSVLSISACSKAGSVVTSYETSANMCKGHRGHFVHSLSGLPQKPTKLNLSFSLGAGEAGRGTSHEQSVTVPAPQVFCVVPAARSKKLPPNPKIVSAFLAALHTEAEDGTDTPSLHSGEALRAALEAFFSLWSTYKCLPSLDDYTALLTSLTPGQAVFAAVVLGRCLGPPTPASADGKQAFEGCLAKAFRSKPGAKKHSKVAMPCLVALVEDTCVHAIFPDDEKPTPIDSRCIQEVHVAELPHDFAAREILCTLSSALAPDRAEDAARVWGVSDTLSTTLWSGVREILRAFSADAAPGRAEDAARIGAVIDTYSTDLLLGVRALLHHDASHGGTSWIMFIQAVAHDEGLFVVNELLDGVAFCLKDAAGSQALDELVVTLASAAPAVADMEEAHREAFCATLLAGIPDLGALLRVLAVCEQASSGPPAEEGPKLLHLVLGSHAGSERVRQVFSGHQHELGELSGNFRSSSASLRQELQGAFLQAAVRAWRGIRATRVDPKRMRADFEALVSMMAMAGAQLAPKWLELKLEFLEHSLRPGADGGRELFLAMLGALAALGAALVPDAGLEHPVRTYLAKSQTGTRPAQSIVSPLLRAFSDIATALGPEGRTDLLRDARSFAKDLALSATCDAVYAALPDLRGVESGEVHGLLVDMAVERCSQDKDMELCVGACTALLVDTAESATLRATAEQMLSNVLEGVPDGAVSNVSALLGPGGRVWRSLLALRGRLGEIVRERGPLEGVARLALPLASGVADLSISLKLAREVLEFGDEQTRKRDEQIRERDEQIRELLVCVGGPESAAQYSEDIRVLRAAVDRYVHKAGIAGSFVQLCERAQLKGFRALRVEDQRARQDDLDRPVSQASPQPWWPEVCPESLVDCEAFLHMVRARLAASGRREKKQESADSYRSVEDDDDDVQGGSTRHNDQAHPTDETDGGYLSGDSDAEDYERWELNVDFFKHHLPGYMKEFRFLWRSMVATFECGELLTLEMVRACVAFGEGDIDTGLESGVRVTGVEMPAKLRARLTDIARFDDVADDMRAVLAAAGACRFYITTSTDVRSSGPQGSVFFASEFVREAAWLWRDHLPATRRALRALASPGMADIVRFLEPLIRQKEDLRNLMNAVEEHSDEFIKADTVSALLDVQTFLGSVLSARDRRASESEFVAVIHRALQEHEHKAIDKKLRMCISHRNGLQTLYRNLSNRQEVTAERVQRAVSEGIFAIDCKADKVVVEMRVGNRKIPYHEMLDLRARTLLRREGYNSDKAGSASIGEEFVRQVDLACALCANLEKLREEGHPVARRRSDLVGNPGARARLDSLNTEAVSALEEWRRVLPLARAEMPLLANFHSTQLWVLSDLAEGRRSPTVAAGHRPPMEAQDLEAATDLLQFASGITFSQEQRDRARRPCYELECCELDAVTQPEEWLRDLGQELDSILAYVPSRQHLQHPAAVPGELDFETPLQSLGEAGEPRVVVAQSRSDVFPIALAFYSSAQRLPRASEVLFCRADTPWSQIDAFLARFMLQDGVFCMLNAEVLGYQKQQQLVQWLSGANTRGSASSMVVVVLAESDAAASAVHILREMAWLPGQRLSEAGVQRMLTRMAPGLGCIASEDAACGKTEVIHQQAASQGKQPVTVHISGPLDVEKLIARLRAVQWQSWHCLHLDVGHTPSPALLSDVLLQLGLWRVLQSGSSVLVIPVDVVYVEIANLSDVGLLRELPFCHMVWPSTVRFDLHRFIVTKNPRSPIQVVCRALDALDVDALNTRSLGLGTGAPLATPRCRELLQRYLLASVRRPSYALVHALLRILAVEIASFDTSVYFDCGTLQDLKQSPTLRSELVRALLETAVSFMAPAVSVAKLRQRGEVNANRDADLSGAFGQMARWSNVPPMLLFHRFDRQTLSLVFRDATKVKDSFSRLFRSQAEAAHQRAGWRLPDYTAMRTKELEERLGRIVLAQGRTLGAAPEGSCYVVSPDNFLKMIWIALRIETRVPVIIMGETGCGKTSLIRHLARLMRVGFECLNIHAGTSDDDIVSFVEKCSGMAAVGEEVWAFLDEVNTCDHLGVIADIVCHHAIHGKHLPGNLVFIAACNPYRLKDAAGAAACSAVVLSDTSRRRKHAELVYSVHELPETMFEFLWDFGGLGEAEETSYIEAMATAFFKENPGSCRLFARLIWVSHRFISKNMCDVLLSLRDVKRCIDLASWFMGSLANRNRIGCPGGWRKWFRGRFFDEALRPEQILLRAMLNALAVSYHCRLATVEMRRSYRTAIEKELEAGQVPIFLIERWTRNYDDRVMALLKNEMKLYLACMEEVPANIAANDALLENVFVVTVCILNRIPVFVVGKPGNSKSLALKVINQNLRGAGSESVFWRAQPQVYVISYQGSAVSTSEGILKVFERARTYRKSNPQGVQVVVHFDEIGLAEASPNNPLKVLHSLLEPGYPKDRPDEAVVGLSNFPLDAAKMNRGITLYRPPPTKNDLKETIFAIAGSFEKPPPKELLECLAGAYKRYYDKQDIPDFHGLRDFYALAKSISAKWPLTRRADATDIIFDAICRNFGGLAKSVSSQKHQPIFNQNQFLRGHWEAFFHSTSPLGYKTINVQSMIEQNLGEKQTARHLMLICTGAMEVAMELVEVAARQQQQAVKVMVGSQFKDDQSDHHSFSLLKRIILCMEEGVVLVLKGLDNIYGSLFDMLNMSYMTVGNRLHCRIALGHADSLACVHENFRCIVLVDATQLGHMDAAFLNRFEKHRVDIADIITPGIRQASHRLEIRCQLAATTRVETTGNISREQFYKLIRPLFVGFCAETVPSLLALLSNAAGGEAAKPQELEERAWRYLADFATTDGVLRATDVTQPSLRADAEALQRASFSRPRSLRAWLQQNMAMHCMVFTFSPQYTNLAPLLHGVVPAFQVVQVDALTSECDLENAVKAFRAKTVEGAMLVLQLSADSPHVDLVKHHVKAELPVDRRALLLLHGSRALFASAPESSRLRVSFRSGWSAVLLEQLEEPTDPLTPERCVELSFEELLGEDGAWPFSAILKKVLSSCFWFIKYPRCRDAAEHVQAACKFILGDPRLVEMMRMRSLRWIGERHAGTGPWWRKLVTNTRLLNAHCQFSDCARAFIQQQVQHPIAMLLYELESACALRTLMDIRSGDAEGEDLRNVWFDLCKEFVRLECAPPTGMECYPYHHHLQALRVPFSAYFAERIDEYRQVFFEHRLHECDAADWRLEDFRRSVREGIGLDHWSFLSRHATDYAVDLVALRLTAVPLPQSYQVQFLEPILRSQAAFQRGTADLVDVHVFLWLHTPTLLAMLRQLAATPLDLYDFRAVCAGNGARGAASERFEEYLAGTAAAVLQTSCSAVLSSGPAASSAGAQWMAIAARVLSAGRGLLRCVGVPRPPLELSALELMFNFNYALLMQGRSAVASAHVAPPAPLNSASFAQFAHAALTSLAQHAHGTHTRRFELLAWRHLLAQDALAAAVLRGRQHLPTIATAFLCRSLIEEALKSCGDDCFSDLITQRVHVGDTSALEALDAIVSGYGVSAPVHALLCTILEDCGFPALQPVDAEEDCEEFACSLRSAAACLGELEQEGVCLVQVASAALLRRSVAASVRHIGAGVTTPVTTALGVVCSQASMEAEQGGGPLDGLGTELRLFVAKQLRDHLKSDNVPDLQHALQRQCSAVPWLAGMRWDDSQPPLLAGCVPVFLAGFLAPEGCRAAQAVSAAVVQKSEDDVRQILDSAGRSRPSQFALFAACACLLCPRAHDRGSAEVREAGRRRLLRALTTSEAPDTVAHWLTRALGGAEGVHRDLAGALTSLDGDVLLCALTALHVAAMVDLAPPSKMAAPLKRLVMGNIDGYVATMPEDEVQVALRALAEQGGRFGGGHTRYACKCGFLFLVGDCGEAVQGGTCPQCRGPIGGVRYAELHVGNRRIDRQPTLGGADQEQQRGYIDHAPSRDERMAVRQLTPSTYRVEHFVVHSALLGYAFLHPEDNVFRPHAPRLLEHLQADWQCLHKSFGAPAGILVDTASRLLSLPADMASAQEAPQGAAERASWERSFAAELVEPSLGAPRRDEFAAQLSWSAALGSEPSMIDLQLQELCPPLASSEDGGPEQDAAGAGGGGDGPVGSGTRGPIAMLLGEGTCLELGAGNFSFAVALARQRGDARGIVATTLEPLDVVVARYPAARNHVTLLQSLGATAVDGVDATTLDDAAHAAVRARPFDIVLFNRPHAGTFMDKRDWRKGPPEGEHRALMAGLFGTAGSVLREDGRVVLLLFKQQFVLWNVKTVAERNGFALGDICPFASQDFPGYQAVYGDDRDFPDTSGGAKRNPSFLNKRDSAFYVFRRVPADTPRDGGGEPPPEGGIAGTGTQLPGALPPHEAALSLARFFRAAGRPTLDQLQLEIWGQASHAERHALLAALLDARAAGVELTRHLVPVVEWAKLVRRHMSCRLERAKARTMTVGHFLDKLDGSEPHAGHRQLFKHFSAGWAQCAEAGLMQRHGCRDLRRLEGNALQMGAGSPIMYSCPDEKEDAGMYILALLGSLIGKQNQFLERALEVGQADHGGHRVRSVSEYWFLKGRVTLPRVDVLDAMRTQVVCARGSADFDGLLDFGCCGALCAWEAVPQDTHEGGSLLRPGRCVAFDLELMEQWATEHFVDGKALLDLDRDALAFPFAGEAFERNFRFLEELCGADGVPQALGPEESMAALVESVGSQDILMSVEAAAVVLRRVRPAPDTPLAEFCCRWLPGSPLAQAPEDRSAVTVGSIVSLYEYAESRLIHATLQELPARYRAGLPAPLQEASRRKWRGPSAAAVSGVLGRIAVRWLAHESLQADLPVADYVALANKQVPPSEGLPAELFEGLCMCHVFRAAELSQSLMHGSAPVGQSN